MKKSQSSKGLKIGHFMCHEPGSVQTCSGLRRQTCIALREDLEKHELEDEVGELYSHEKVC